MKKCFKCLIAKPLDEFYVHKQMLDGHLNKCKECTRADTKQSRENNKEYYLLYDRQRGATEERKAKNRARNKTEKQIILNRKSRKKWDVANREKKRAHLRVSRAAKRGVILKEHCVVCYSVKTEAHHPDYSKPLLVIWLCKDHHAMVHKIENAIKRAG